MRRIIFLFIFVIAVITTTLALVRSQDEEELRSYDLVFFDDFKSVKLDTKSWSIIARDKPAWAKYMSSNKSLIQHKSGYLRLFARYNEHIEPNDTAKFLTAGISTEKKRTIKYGKVEVRARFHGATGSWPAIWLFHSEPSKTWPDPKYAEIDILEYPNREDYIMQTVHNYYTMHLKKIDNPQHTARPKVNAERFNIYAVEVLPDVIIFSINGEETFRYPKIDTKDTGQFPFGCESFLMLDMQVGAAWLPKPDKSTYPAYMDIDWVKMYKLRN